MRALLCLALLSCDAGGLAPQAYRGEAIAIVPVIDHIETLAEHEGPVAVAAFWRPTGAGHAGRAALTTLIEHPNSGMPLPAERQFRLAFFEPPPAEAMTDYEGASIALGHLMAFADDDGDLSLGEEEEILAVSQGRAILYAPQALSERSSPTGIAVPAGFHLARTPMWCGTWPETTEGDCGVPLGSNCEVDADCGNGTCLLEFGVPVSGGACVVSEPPADGCRPGDGALRGDPTSSELVGVWFPGCRSDADCSNEGEVCELVNGLCNSPLDIPLRGGQPAVPPVCAGRAPPMGMGMGPPPRRMGPPPRE